MSTLPVIAAVDGSDGSLRALEWALGAARRRSAPLRVVHVRQYAHWAQPEVLAAGPPDPRADPVLDRVREHVEDLSARPDTEYVGLEGAPGAVLPELGSSAQLLVLGSRGRGGFASLLLGSNGMAAARDAECPVVVVPRPGRDVPGEAPSGPGPRVVVGLKVDGPDEATLEFAFAEAARRGARLQAVAAYPWPAQPWMTPGDMPPPIVDQDVIEDETRVLAEGFLAPHRERHPDVRAETLPAAGDAAGHLVAASPGADLVVVGRHRRHLLAPARMMGSVTHAVLLHAASPVAVVPPAPPED
ncbi:universal stress protein [Streptomyces afghaniensis]|uniref:universal stress protein n=1 Tax=Streptomyces afghaniensis TaxID=66865 RepID=UPI002780696F|nr:universal stress protein [Streptomyces afghaniensis]MDQ1013903.1 nucleotide-binding universal stress UspA family protein [Streptomyces afghaniensis]